MGYSRERLEELGPIMATGLQTFPRAIRDDLTALGRVENQAAAERVLKTAGFADFHAYCLRTLRVDEHLIRDLTLAEIASALTCSEIVAGNYLTAGELLTDRAPKIREAFRAGDLDYARVAALTRVLGSLDGTVIAAIEDELLAAARHHAPGRLQVEAERILIAYDPDLASTRAQDARTRRRTRRRNAPFGMAWFEAFLTADEALNLEGMIDEVANTVCARDPRTAGQRRADAFLALTRGEPAIACQCQRDNCPHFLATTHRPGNAPHVYVHADLATLMQLANNPAVLAGYGPICPDYARLLAENATWQLLINEGKRLAEHWQDINPDDGDEGEGGDDDGGEDWGGVGADCGGPVDGPDGGPNVVDGGDLDGADAHESTSEADAEDTADASTAAASAAADTNADEAADSNGGDGEGVASDAATNDVTDPDPDPESVDDPAYEEHLDALYAEHLAAEALHAQRQAAVEGTVLPAHTRMLLGRSRPAPPIPLAAWYRTDKIRFTPAAALVGDGTLIDRILHHLNEHPEDAAGLHPDGHGGHTEPPDRALTYRPTARLKALVRARDGHCRFPGCSRPARKCEVDHMVPFHHARPRAGGWTIESNLHCLCKHHHQLKTDRAWNVAGLAGSAEVWTSLTGLTQVTLPAGFRTCVVPPNIDLDRTPLPPVDRPPHLRAAPPAPETADASENDAGTASTAEPPPF